MKLSQPVVTETRRIAIGTGILCVVMLGVFLAIGQLTWPVAAGALVGYALAVGNFFIMAVDVARLMDNIDPADESAAKTAKAKIRLSYNRRMIALLVILIIAIFVLNVSYITALIPLICPRIVIKAYQFMQTRKAAKKGSDA